MFVGFNAHITEQGVEAPLFYEYGKKLYYNQKEEMQIILKDYSLNEGVIDASQIEQDWFPSIKADVFISHSHRDQKLAIALAGWLYTLFGITSFIDSCVWGYADDLLKVIDNKYCVKKRKADGSAMYNYKKRNRSTSHVHMILNMALQKMIDKTECLLFLNTPNSLMVDDIIHGTATASPWIYSELSFSKICQKKKLLDYRPKLIHGAIQEYTQLNVKYNISLSHLIHLEDSDLLYLSQYSRGKKSKDVLDDLYEYLGLINKERVIDGK